MFPGKGLRVSILGGCSPTERKVFVFWLRLGIEAILKRLITHQLAHDPSIYDDLQL